MEYLKRAEPHSDTVAEEVRDTVSEILLAVEREGVEAVRRYSARFDDWDPPSFLVGEDERAAAESAVDPELRAQIEFACEQIEGFARLQRQTLTDLEAETLPGVHLGHRHVPVGSVGAYTPGGRYPLIASALMTVATPKIAGVGRVVACAPPSAGVAMHPAQLHAMVRAGADDILCVGGVQALAALAYGIEDVSPVDMIVGAGNAYVAEAKRQLFGTVGIDLLAGPTEILVIADESADPSLVAADLLGQAEHGPNSPAVLVTTSRPFGEAVGNEVERWLEGSWPTAQVAGAAWHACGEVVIVEDREEAAEVADRYATEHLELQTSEDQWYSERLLNYGTVFVGSASTVAYSDKAIGTNHVLPTGRAARYTGGLWVGKFLKTLTFQRVDPAGTPHIAPAAAAIAEAENMLGHALTAKLREQRDA